FGKILGKSDDTVIFGFVAYLAPAWMIPVLLASLCVTPGCLNMSIGLRANPDVGPGRRNAERFDAFQFNGVANGFAIRTDIAKVFPCSLTLNTRRGISYVTQTSSFSRLN